MEHPHKDEWENVEGDLHPVDQTEEVLYLYPDNLNSLQGKTTYDSSNNNSSGEVETTPGSCT